MKPSLTVGNVRKCSNCFQMKDLSDFYVKRAKHGEVKRYNTKNRNPESIVPAVTKFIGWIDQREIEV